MNFVRYRGDVYALQPLLCNLECACDSEKGGECNAVEAGRMREGDFLDLDNGQAQERPMGIN